jgi:type IV pilus assembly protein PilQ
MARPVALAAGLAALIIVAAAGTPLSAARAAAPARLLSVSSSSTPTTTSLRIQANEPVAYVASQPDPLTLVLDLRGATAAGVATDFGSAVHDPIRAVAVEDTRGADGPAARVRIALDRPVAPHVASNRSTIRVDLDRQVAADAPAAPAAAASALALLAPNAIDPMSALQQAPGLVQAVAYRGDQKATTPITLNSAEPVAGSVEKHYSGHPVSLDFQAADLKAVLRTFSEISGLNVVIDPTVSGSVDVALHDVPWDQALDIILRANKLGYAVDGSVVRIAPLKVLEDEEKQQHALAQAQALSGTLQVLTRTLSYAKADDLQALLTKTVLTPRGSVQVDQRTNTLIITDLPTALTTAADLITKLDQPQPQVEIEARIVQTNKTFARALGLQWGLGANLDAAHGNTLPFTFPNSAGLSASSNLGVNAAPSTASLALGSLNGALNLDVAISAAENNGSLRILSTPRVTTQNNTPAEITQGVQIPIQTVANNTVTVSFKDAALTLKVVPQITAANTVIMQIALENASPDFSRAVNGIPPIDTQRANTQVLVKDGQTTVIGGIVVNQSQNSNDRTPGLSQIPLLGWLFKRDTVNDQNNELLIFITPKIIRQ